MVEVLKLFRFQQATGDDKYFASYRVDDITSWIYVNIDDFYSWLKQTDPNYYKVVRNRHFFFKKYTILEEFRSNDSDRAFLAKRALDSYFECCYRNNGLQDFSKMVDLQTMSPLFREVQLLFVHNNNNFFSYYS